MSGQVGLSANHRFTPQIQIMSSARLGERMRVIPASGPPNHGDLQLIRPAHLP